MEKVTIEGIEVKDSWSQVTLREFIRLAEIEVDKELEARPFMKALKRISAVTGIEEDRLMNLDSATFGHATTAVKFCDTEPETLFSEQKTFIIDNVEYGYRRPGALTSGEYITLESAIASARRHKRSVFPDLLALLIRPIERKEDAELGEIIEIEPFNVARYDLRVVHFMDKLTVPFFIHALSRIINGAHGIKKLSKNFTTRPNTTPKGNRSKKK